MVRASAQRPLDRALLPTPAASCQAAGSPWSAQVGASLRANLDAFEAGNGMLAGHDATRNAIAPFQHAAIAVGPVALKPSENVTLDVIMTWNFPTHCWGGSCDCDLGNFAQPSASSSSVGRPAVDTAARILGRRADMEEQAVIWHKLTTDNDFPVWLQDFLLNSPAALYKISMWTRDGRWRMWESHTCADLQPGHLHFYHALILNNLWPWVGRQIVEFDAASQFPSGQLSNSFGNLEVACGFDRPDPDPGNNSMAGGLSRLDTVAVFVLDSFMHYQWWGDGAAFLKRQYHPVVLAVNNMVRSSAMHGLPRKRFNTFDGGLFGETNSYNAFLYLTALAAGIRLADASGDTASVAQWRAALTRGRQALDTQFWDESLGGHYRGVWCDQNTTFSRTVMGDATYGLTWAVTLGLLNDIGLNLDRVKKHEITLRRINLTPDGIRFSSPRPANVSYSCTGFQVPGRNDDRSAFYNDDDVWPSASNTHAILALATNATSAAEAFEVVENMVRAYRDRANDFFDFRDLANALDADTPGNDGASVGGPSPDPAVPFRPMCNSHYARQLNVWQMVHAWSGQTFDAHFHATTRAGDMSDKRAGSSRGLLSLQPHPVARSFPVMLPSGFGIVRLDDDGHGLRQIEWLSGTLKVAELRLRGEVVVRSLALHAGQEYVAR